MYAAPFEYVRASSWEEAVEQLSEVGEDARVIAGGQSLAPMMMLGLAQPAVLVDIAAAGERKIVCRNGTIVLPALTTGLAGTPITPGAAMCPDFLREGSGVDDFFNAPLMVVGTADPHVAKAVTGLFGFLDQEARVVEPRTAESLKYACNAFHATKVSFANEMARLCEAVGADAREVERGLRSEPRIGQKAYIRPGGAFAGGTLARDVVALTRLAKEFRDPAAIFPAILAGNDAHKDWALGRLRALLPALESSTVAVLGLTYKPGTSTLRRSGAVELVAKLLAAGVMVRCYDPAVAELPPGLSGAALCPTLEDALAAADAAVVATEWPQIKTGDWPALVGTMRQGVVIDANGFLDLRPEKTPGVEYFAVGTPVH